MEYYSALKKHGIMIFTVKWMELEKKNILSEAIQTEKDKLGM